MNPSGARCHLSFARFLPLGENTHANTKEKGGEGRFKVGIVRARRLPLSRPNPSALTGPAYYGAGIITVPRHISRMEIPRIVGDDDTEIPGGIAPQCRVHRVGVGEGTSMRGEQQERVALTPDATFNRYPIRDLGESARWWARGVCGI